MYDYKQDIRSNKAESSQAAAALAGSDTGMKVIISTFISYVACAYDLMHAYV